VPRIRPKLSTWPAAFRRQRGFAALLTNRTTQQRSPDRQPMRARKRASPERERTRSEGQVTEATAEVASPRRAFATSLAATASNPMTIVSWAAVFSAASTAGADDPLPLVAGVGVGSIAWFTVLSAGASLARRRVGRRTVQILDVVSGAGILGFAGVLGYKTLR